LPTARRGCRRLGATPSVGDDRAQRAVSGASTLVDPNEILIRDAEGIEREEKSRASSPARRAWKLGLDSADAIISFKPEDHLHRIAPRPVMLVAVREDVLMPYREVERLFAKLHEPKRLLTLNAIRHHDIYEPHRLDEVMRQVTAFLEEGGG
jgi:pimeloyl-ACP methyl ester carboxylesterase